MKLIVLMVGKFHVMMILKAIYLVMHHTFYNNINIFIYLCGYYYIMVSIQNRKKDGKDKYYLVYSYRIGKSFNTIEKYLGQKKPIGDDLDKLHEELIVKIVEKLWIEKIQVIKKNYDVFLKDISSFMKADQLKEFGVRFTHNTNKIEGSSLTLIEVATIINDKDVPINKSTNDINEAQFHMRSYDDMLKCKALSMDAILNWHKILFTLHKNRNNIAGVIRKGQIAIYGSNHVPPQGGIVCEMLINNLFNWYNRLKDVYHPVLIACLMHFRFISIHPLNDGNGRMTRLLTNFILFKYKYPMFDIPASIRLSYYKALEKANVKEDESIFVRWFFKNYLKAHKKLQ